LTNGRCKIKPVGAKLVADSAVGKTVHAWIERLLASVEKPPLQQIEMTEMQLVRNGNITYEYERTRPIPKISMVSDAYQYHIDLCQILRIRLADSGSHVE
jgi:hypothetical protein